MTDDILAISAAAQGDPERPIDAAAREHAVAAPGSVLVQAPAGSGKTTLLAQRFLRLLAVVDAPERVLALTFTRRAAQEMRERVMHAIAAAAAVQCPENMNRLTWQLGRAAKRRMNELGVDLDRHPSRLRIETIDAFNAWLAGQMPITAGAGSRLNLTEKAAPLYQEAARRALAHDQPDPFGQAVERVLAEGDQRWESLLGLISDMLPSRERWLPLLAGHLRVTALEATQLRDVRRRFDEDLELLVVRTLATAHEAIGGERLQILSRLMHAAAARVDSADPTVRHWQADGSVLRAETGDIERWRGVARLLLTNDSTYRSQFTKTQGFPPKCPDKPLISDLVTELARLPAVLHALVEIRAAPNPRYDDEQWSRVREVAQVLVLAAAQLEQVFRERGMVDFPAVSMAAARALGTDTAPSDLGLRLDYRLQHILIDEFQDTSSAQLDLLRLLTAGWQRGDGRSVFCVGDPMQSIYGFRQAEVRAFLELAEEGVGDVRFDAVRLRSNFRSARPLVEWINQCFSRILPSVDDRNRGAIAFRASEAAQRTVAQESVVRIQGFASRLEEAQAIADLIAAQTARCPQWRIAVLVRAKAHARDIASSLRARNVAYQAVDIEPLQDRPAVRDLLTLIRALLHLGDRDAWLALLRAPWAGLVLADLLRVARGGAVIWNSLADEAVLATLSEDGRRRCVRIRSVLDSALHARSQGSVTRWVEQTWLALGGAGYAESEDLQHAALVLARLYELERQGIPDAADWQASFEDLFAECRDASPVEIMTIHKAKGLEFDMVVVPALDRVISSRNQDMLLSHQFSRSGRDGMVMAARPGIGGETDSLFDFLHHQSRDAAHLEAERLLYVACTRAKWQLHLTATVDAQPKAGSLLAVLWPVAASEFAPAAAAMTQVAVSAEPRGGPLRRVPLGWSPDVAHVLESGKEISTPTTPRVETPVFDWAGETARRVGSLVHAELQALDLGSSDQAAVRRREPQYRRRLALQGVPQDRLEDASSRVVAALVAVHADPRAAWILQKWQRYDVREHALSGRWQNEIVRVVFDRSFIDDAGVRWVIDYKTSQHSGGRLEEFLDSEVERYRGQLARYAELARRLGPEPVRVGLYFPLMRAWREWAP